MFGEKNRKTKEVITDFFTKMGFVLEIKSTETADKTIFVKIRAEEPQILIGQNGQTLSEIQHLLKAILRRKNPEIFYLDIDINDYKKKKIDYLKETARSLADEVSLTKKEKILAPMPAYERRIIHFELAERKDVKCESFGEEPERRLVIRPV